MASATQQYTNAELPPGGAASLANRGMVRHVSWPSMASRTADWDELTETASEPNPFFESWYLLPSLQAFDSAGKVVMLRYEEDGLLRGLLPIHRPMQYYGRPIPHFAGWVHANTFLGTPLVAHGSETRFWRALLDWADANAGSAMFLHLTELNLDGPVHAALGKVLIAQERRGAVVQRDERAMLQSGPTAESYRRANFPKHKHRDLRRRSNRLSELGELRFVWCTGPDSVEDWADRFLQLEASGWKALAGSALIQDEGKCSLFRRSLIEAAQRDRLIRLSLVLDDQPIAMLSTFLTPPGAFGYKTAFDERYAKFAPGILLESEFISALDRKLFDWCDSCAAPDHTVMNEMWGERRAIGKVSIAIGGALRRSVFHQLLRREMAGQPTGFLS